MTNSALKVNSAFRVHGVRGRGVTVLFSRQLFVASELDGEGDGHLASPVLDVFVRLLFIVHVSPA